MCKQIPCATGAFLKVLGLFPELSKIGFVILTQYYSEKCYQRVRILLKAQEGELTDNKLSLRSILSWSSEKIN